MSNLEQTLSIIKPDAVERNLDQEIKEMFTHNGFKILKQKNYIIEYKKTILHMDSDCELRSRS